MATFNHTQRVFARERLTVTNGAVVTLTASKYLQAASPVGGNQNGAFKRKAGGALIMPDSGSGAIHYSMDGTAPTTGTAVTDVGAYAAATDVVSLESLDSITLFKMIALAADAIVEVWYLR